MTPLDVSYSPQVAGGLPSRLLLRCWREGGGPGVREARFYDEIAPLSPHTPTVPCYDAVCESDTGRWHVLLRDISLTHAPGPEPLTPAQRSFLMPGYGDPGLAAVPYSAATYEAVVAAVASLHARWWDDALITAERHWGSPDGPHCMCRAGDADSLGGIAQQWIDRVMPRYRRAHPDDPPAEQWQLCERAARSWPDLFGARIAAGNLTLTQGDGHLGNVFLSRSRPPDRVYLLDWDAYQRGIGPWDLAYMLVISHAPAIRRRVELDVLRAYHECLAADGVAGYSYDQCLADYRLAVLGCLFPPIAWQKPEFLGYALSACHGWDCHDLVS
jgi:hypothetical protein